MFASQHRAHVVVPLQQLFRPARRQLDQVRETIVATLEHLRAQRAAADLGLDHDLASGPAQLAGVAIESGKGLIADREACLGLADRLGLFVAGVSRG